MFCIIENIFNGAAAREGSAWIGISPAPLGASVCMDTAGLPALIEAIRRSHGLEGKWLEAVPVREKLRGATVWDLGLVTRVGRREEEISRCT